MCILFTLAVFLTYSCMADSKTTATSCSTADDCPFLYCCVKPGGNSIDRELNAHPHGTDIIVGKRAGNACWTKTDVAFLAPREMTDDCPCQRGLYCVANGVFLPGGQVGLCSV